MYLIDPNLEGVFPGRYLIGPDGADPDNGAENAGIGAGQDPVLNGDPLKQPVFVIHLSWLQVLNINIRTYDNKYKFILTQKCIQFKVAYLSVKADTGTALK
jgi:hypothetical protein